jgi:hypothetical protein
MCFVEGRIMRARKDWVARVVTWAVLLSTVCGSAIGRDVQLVIRRQKVSADRGKYSLLPPAALSTDGDAVPLYARAVKSLRPDTDLDQVVAWLAVPVGQLPLQEVQRVLEQHKESLDGAAQAARCRECKWPKLTIGEAMADLAEYRRLGYVISLLTRYEIARGNHEAAIRAMQTGFATGRHLMQAPTVVQFLVGVKIASMICREVEAFAQAEGAPSLHSALMALPAPLADVEKAIENDMKTASSEWSGKLAGEQIGQIFRSDAMKASYDRVRLFAKCLHRDMIALQYIEAIRLYTASHGGQLPQTLADIAEVSLPKDPVTGAAFRYTRTAATAVLESPAPAGDDKGELRYEIAVKN